MPSDELAREITLRRRELGDELVILGHHYQTDEVIQHADFTGDSLKLSQNAANLAKEREGKVKAIIFCGVHFMAETADMLTPSDVSVILPDLSAGCSMADMAQYDDTLLAWERMHDSLREQGWRGTIIPITYVNSSAAIKAFVGERGGACCTSSNARQVLRWALAGGEAGSASDRFRDDVKVLFLPDQHLGRNTAHQLGVDVARHSCVYDPRLTRKGEYLGGAIPKQLFDARVILWAGHCSVHKLFRPEHCETIRQTEPKTKILVHPECCKEVVDASDLAGSTEFIISTIRSAQPSSSWAVGTEVHLVQRLANEAQARGVRVRILSDCQCLCTTMYRIDQPHLLWTLDNLAGQFESRTQSGKPAKRRVVNEVRVPEAVRALALKSLDRMLTLSTPTPSRELLTTAD